MKTTVISTVQAFFLAYLGLNNVSASDVQSRLSPGHLYIKTEVTGKGGIIDLIDSSTTEKIGTSSFDKQRLPTGCRMAIERIQFGVAVVDSTDANSAAAQSYSSNYGDVPAVLRSAHFILSRRGNKVWEGTIDKLLSLSPQGINGRANAYYLDEYRVLEGDEPLNIQIQFPDNVSWPASKKVFVSVSILGPRAQF